jgi:hypothetical protein
MAIRLLSNATFAGNVLIGSTSSAAGVLVVDGNSANNIWVVGRDSDGTGSLSFRNAADNAYNARLEAVSGALKAETNGTLALTIDSSQRVGIGIDAPNAKTNIENGHLLVSQSANTTQENILLQGAGYHIGSTLYGNVSIRSSYNNSSNSGSLNFYTAASGTTTAEKMKLDSSGNLDLSAGGILKGMSVLELKNNGSTDGSATSPRLYSPASGALAFSGNGSERMRIDSSGNVGIGTDSPSAKLTVFNTEADTSINVNTGTGGSYPKKTGISFGATSTSLGGDAEFKGGAGIQVINTAASNNVTDMAFWTTSGGSPSEKMRITSGGNVGIGTDSPSAKLQVQDTNSGVLIDTSTVYTPLIKASGALSDLKLSSIGNGGNLILEAECTTTSIIQFKNGGSERMRITADGKVGIGTTSPASTLEVDGNIQSDTTSIANSAAYIRGADVGIGIGQSASSPYGSWIQSRRNTDGVAFPLSLNPSGSNVGIGTTSPGVKLEIKDSTHTTMKVRSGNDDNIFFAQAIQSSDSRIGTETNTDFTIHTNGAERIRVKNTGNVGIGTNSPLYKVQINAISNGQTALAFMNSAVTADGNGSTNIRFVSATNAQWANASFSAYNFSFFGNGSEKFTILGASGNVGIGETSPQRPLHINGTEGVARFTSTASGNNGFEVGIGTSSQAFLWQSENSYMQFATNNTERMRVNSSGNVGIGTTSPAYKLQVSSTTFIEGTFGDPNTDAAYRLKFYDNGGVHNDPGIGLDGSGGGGEKMWFNAYDGFYWNLGTQGVKMTLTGTGKVGIGNTSPNAPLQFQTIVSTRKIVLFEVGNNDYQFYGFGIEGNTLVYSVGDNGDDHVFFSGQGSSSRREIARLKGNGDILFGTSTKANDFTYFELATNNRRILNIGSSTTSQQTLVNFRNPNGVVGELQTDGSTTSFVTSSDYRLKENVVEMTDALDRVSQLKPSRFNFIANPDKTYDGFLAHEVQDIVPEAISGDKDEVDEDGNEKYQGIDQSKLVPLLVGAIQELKKEIEILKNK